MNAKKKQSKSVENTKQKNTTGKKLTFFNWVLQYHKNNEKLVIMAKLKRHEVVKKTAIEWENYIKGV